jgi:preprotein translocase subunit YajC
MHVLLLCQIGAAAPVVAENGSSPSPLGGLLPLLLMFAVIYFLLLRPYSKQEKDRKKRVEKLGRGDEVVLGGGILGRVSNADDANVWVVEIADRVKVRVLKKDIVDSRAAALKETDKGKGAAKGKEADEAKDANKDKKG